MVERENRESSRGERSSYSKDKDTDLRLNNFHAELEVLEMDVVEKSSRVQCMQMS